MVNEKNEKETTLFTVGTKSISNDEFAYLYKKNHQNGEEFSSESIDEYLDLFIKFKLKVAEAESRGMDTTKAFVKELSGYKEELKRPYLAKEDELERLAKQAYQRMQEEVKASHILISVKPDAPPPDTLNAYQEILAIKERLDQGERFQSLAQEKSDDPSAKTNGGNLGYFTALQMVFPFEEAAFSGTIGEVTGPIRTRFGYHLLKIEDRRPSKGQVEVSHILVRGDGAESKKIIDNVYAKLQQGEQWNDLCAKYSQDPGTKDAGGRLKPFGTGALSSAPTFEEVAFSLENSGDISEPILTPFGWHVVRLERKIPMPTYGEMEESLKRRIARDERMQISKSKALTEKKQRLRFTENASVKSTLLELADSTLTQGKWNVVKEDLPGHDVLFQVGEKPYAVSNFLQYVSQNQRSTNQQPNAYFHQLYDQFVVQTLDEAEDLQLQKEHPEYRRLVTEYREGILLFSIMEEEIWIRASEDSVGQRKYYEEHSEKYKVGERIEAQFFASNDTSLLEEVKSQLIAGDSLEGDAKDRFLEIQQLKLFERYDHVVIDRVPWSVGWHEVEANEIHYLVEVRKIIPPGVRSFKETRANVISDYQDYLEKAWLQNLKMKYPVKINKKNKKEVVKAILASQ